MKRVMKNMTYTHTNIPAFRKVAFWVPALGSYPMAYGTSAHGGSRT
jgi:hypothetical protein